MSSCELNKETRKFRIGFSQCGDADDWRKSMLGEMKRELAFYPEMELLYKQADDNSEKQVQQVRALLKEKINLLIISPNEAQPLTPVVEEAFNSGIPVIVVDRKIASSLYSNYIGADNYQLGKMAGDYVASLLQGKGNIIEVTGLPASSPAIDRDHGFRDALNTFKQIHLIAKVPGDWIKPKAEKEISSLKQMLPSANLIFAHNDVMARGTYEACKTNGANNIKIIGVDALPGMGMELVSNKILTASMLYPTGGAEAIRNAVKILNGQSLGKETLLQTLVVDSSNVHLMKLQSDKMLSQQRDIEKQQDMLAEQKRIYNNQRALLYVLTCSLGLAIFFAGLLFYSRNLNKKINKQLANQNDEISRQSAQLIEMSARAQAAHEARLNFFTNISHEFRTPLTLIMGPVDGMLENPKLQAHTRQQLMLIRNNAMRLLRLVNQLIDFRKIEFNKWKIRASENDLVFFANEIVQAFQEIARKRGIDCRMLTKERQLPVWIDVTMVDKVLYNLLSNSFKFTADNGSIILSIEKNSETDQAIIHVQDNGIGMTPDEQAHAFDTFYQGDHESHKGSGLGLSLSKELIELHRGSISVNSQKGKGTTFTITLPLGNSHFSPEEIATADAGPLADSEKELFIADLLSSIPVIDEQDAPVSEKRKETLLIIEDNPELRQFLHTQLSARYHIIEADNGTKGLQMAFDNLPDVVICDITMPGKDGITLTGLLKNDIRTSHIPVILLTARTAMEQQIEGFRSMADAYITKPFQFAVLNETLTSLLSNRNKLKEHFTTEVPAVIRPGAAKKTDRKFVSEFISVVENNISNDHFVIDDICKAMCISKVQLYRKVKTLMGTNINEYILNARLQKAKYYLQHEDLSVSEVSYKTGFSSPAYFATVFKTKTGVSPTAFKSQR
ncbi:substrate-binding domain-containing protein [Danxiaibacter flavus]|uniref:histidine kinase n=1 Tax=Danxiaibacter flavus TaxID=3049108 RepID=A0ABV3ZDR7_9BACT|nr:substrate-binding domain-containing protein [Chitinophagaceae bacterium DXS]